MILLSEKNNHINISFILSIRLFKPYFIFSHSNYRFILKNKHYFEIENNDFP